MSKKLALVALILGSVSFMGCALNRIEGQYTGTNNVSLSQPGGGGTSGNSRIFQATLVVDGNGQNSFNGGTTITGSITSTSGNNLGNGFNETAKATLAGSREGNNLNAQNVLATIEMNGLQCVAILSGTLNGSADGRILSGTLTGAAQFQYGYGDCGTATFQVNVTRISDSTTNTGN